MLINVGMALLSRSWRLYTRRGRRFASAFAECCQAEEQHATSTMTMWRNYPRCRPDRMEQLRQGSGSPPPYWRAWKNPFVGYPMLSSPANSFKAFSMGWREPQSIPQPSSQPTLWGRVTVVVNMVDNRNVMNSTVAYPTWLQCLHINSKYTSYS